MGHDIDIVNMNTNETVSCLYYTSNWSKDICFRVDKWKLPYMFNGHSGKTIARILKEILKEFEDVEGNDDVLDGWGHPIEYNNIRSNDRKTAERKEIWCRQKFKKILERFLETAEKYPKEYWYSDIISEKSL